LPRRDQHPAFERGSHAPAHRHIPPPVTKMVTANICSEKMKRRTFVRFPIKDKKNFKNFKKTIDKLIRICYNIDVARGKGNRRARPRERVRPSRQRLSPHGVSVCGI
jgi:hypothetical protein